MRSKKRESLLQTKTTLGRADVNRNNREGSRTSRTGMEKMWERRTGREREVRCGDSGGTNGGVADGGKTRRDLCST